jgi:chromosome partitioning related protein ParA
MPFNREKPMQVVSIISTKGGVGKTTTAANLGGFAADAGLRVLLLDLDVQPTLSSYFTLAERAPAGIYEMLAYNEQRAEQLVSRTAIERLDLVLSNDDRGELNTLLLHAPDGRLRLRHLLPTLAPRYDLLLIDTQGARSVLLEMAVLASNLALSPVTPEILAARELRRGTLQLIEDIAPYRHLGIEPPPLHLLINRVHPVSSNARLIQQALRQVFQEQPGVRVLDTDVPAIEAYPRAATRGCRCIGWSTASRRAARHPPRWRPCARWPASCSRRGRSALRSSPAEAMRGGRPWPAHMTWPAATSGCER